MKEIVSKEQCTGCMLCAEVCPHNAIQCRNEIKNGYYYPSVDQSVCTDCSLCQRKCPQYKDNRDGLLYQDHTTYLAWATDQELRKSSSSGGVFTVLAEYFLSIGGVVIGAAYNEDYSVSHIAVEDVEDLWRLRLSKYVQSDTSSIWSTVKRYVADKRPVLFSGVPCQIDALNHFFDKLPDNLYTIDLVCRGVPSPILWQEYLTSVRNKWNREPISYINYRHKGGFGWTQRKVAIGFQDERMYISTRSEDPFAQLFFNNIVMRNSCFECRYSDTKRVGDLTLGDFWALRDASIENKERGLSMILCNSTKGGELLDKARQNLFIEKIENIDISVNNSGLGRKHRKAATYDSFWKTYDIFGFSHAVYEYLSQSKKNHSSEIYNKLSILHMHGIHIADILRFMGINTVYVYGAGKMGELLLSELSDEIVIPAIFDQSVNKDTHVHISRTNEDGKKVEIEYPLLSPDRIPDDDVTVIITPAGNGSDIIDSLTARGVSKKRLITLNVLLYYGVFYWRQLVEKTENHRFPDKEFLITGAQFMNKGAQSMLFTAVSEIRDRFDDAVIWFCPNYAYEEHRKISDQYKMLFLLDGMERGSTLYEIMPRLCAVIDVSGYALTSNDSVNKTDRILNFLRLADDFKTPIFLMPQSVGPFDYDERRSLIIGKVLSYADTIFVRERSGYEHLINTYGLSNVKYSRDLVLQNTDINPDHIYANKKRRKEFHLATDNNVALIPNVQNYRNGNPQDVLKLYRDIVSELLLLGKNVYIISHSDDESICDDIYASYRNDMGVYLFEGEFDCLEFGQLLENFQYIIGSRYHAIVHAYKKHIPCIAIGWAEKYQELLESFGQEKYLFDVRCKIDTEEVLTMLRTMDRLYMTEAAKIAEILPKIQMESCFDVLGNLSEN